MSLGSTELDNAPNTSRTSSPKLTDSLLSTEWAKMKRKEEAAVSRGRTVTESQSVCLACRKSQTDSQVQSPASPFEGSQVEGDTENGCLLTARRAVVDLEGPMVKSKAASWYRGGGSGPSLMEMGLKWD